MQVVKLWYYPRVLVNKDPLESDGETYFDYKQLIKSEIYFDDNKSVEDIESAVIDIRNTSIVSLDSWQLMKKGGES